MRYRRLVALGAALVAAGCNRPGSDEQAFRWTTELPAGSVVHIRDGAGNITVRRAAGQQSDRERRASLASRPRERRPVRRLAVRQRRFRLRHVERKRKAAAAPAIAADRPAASSRCSACSIAAPTPPRTSSPSFRPTSSSTRERRNGSVEIDGVAAGVFARSIERKRERHTRVRPRWARDDQRQRRPLGRLRCGLRLDSRIDDQREHSRGASGGLQGRFDLPRRTAACTPICRFRAPSPGGRRGTSKGRSERSPGSCKSACDERRRLRDDPRQSPATH